MLTSCASCSGFLPPSASRCPHCGVAAPAPGGGLLGSAMVKGLLATGAGSAFAVTLMACYGCPTADGICENPSPTTGAGGMGGMGGMGGSPSTSSAGTDAGCLHCSEALAVKSLDVNTLCATSKTLYQDAKTCICSAGCTCSFTGHPTASCSDAAACGTQILCGGAMDSTSCGDCLADPANTCASKYALCKGD